MSNQRPALTEAILCSGLLFKLQVHLNGGSAYSTSIEHNEQYQLALTTTTNGSPHYKIISRTLSDLCHPDIKLDLMAKPLDLAGFVAAYNAASEEDAQ
jgi:hypothetical protein